MAACSSHIQGSSRSLAEGRRKNEVREKEKDVIGHHPAFFGHFLETEIEGFLKAVGEWLLCFMDAPETRSKKICVLAVRSGDAEVSYIHLTKAEGNEFNGTPIPKQPDGRLALKSIVSTPGDNSSKSAESAEIPECIRSLRKLITEYETRGIPVVGTVLKTVAKRPTWLLRYRTVSHNHDALIGTGNFGRVIRGTLLMAHRASIRIAIKSVVEGDTETERFEARKKVIREADIQLISLCDNVVQCFGVCADLPQLSVIMELCNGGGLDDHIQKRWAEITPNEFPFLIADVCRGLKQVHKLRYLHRDVALRNCLVSWGGRVKLSDFGLACSLDELARNDKDAIIRNVPIRWMAPETLQRKPVFSYASDLWALAMLFYEVYNHGEQPWPGFTTKQIKHFICDGPMPTMPDSMPEPLRNVIQKCWIKDPAKRGTLDDIGLALRSVRSDPRFPPANKHELSIFKLHGVRYQRRDKTAERATQRIGASKRTV